MAGSRAQDRRSRQALAERRRAFQGSESGGAGPALARLGDDADFDVLREMLSRERLENEQHLSESQIEAIMTNAAKGLALIQNPDSIKILRSVSREEKNLRVRQAAIDAMRYWD